MFSSGHIYSMSTLDGHLEIDKVYETDKTGDNISFLRIRSLLGSDVSEKPKHCPDCRKPITSLRRYGRILRLIELKRLELKHMMVVDKALLAISQRLEDINSTISTIAKLTKLESLIRKSPMNRVFEACGGVDSVEATPPPSAQLIRCLELRGALFGKIAERYDDENFVQSKAAYNAAIEVATNSKSIQSGIKLRIGLVKLILKFCNDVYNCRDELNNLLDWALSVDVQTESIQALVENARSLKRAIDSQPDQNTIKEVIMAMNKEHNSAYGGSASDHWFQCPNGHPYFIGECAGAMEESRCFECGELVGGTSHRLLSTNRSAGGAFRDL